jgi:spermidine/putrescine transport system permease protein
MPGIAVATVISFAWNIGAYAAPALLGGGPERTFAVEVESQMLLNLNWPLASALAIFMMVFILVCIMAILTGLNRIGGGVENVQ